MIHDLPELAELVLIAVVLLTIVALRLKKENARGCVAVLLGAEIGEHVFGSAALGFTLLCVVCIVYLVVQAKIEGKKVPR